MHEVHFNLACIEGLKGNVVECIEHLKNWKKHQPAPTKINLDGDVDFDRVRKAPEFQAFRNSLPD